MKIIENVTFDNQEKAITEAGHDHLLITKVNVNATETNQNATTSLYGGDVRRCTLVDVDTYIFQATDILRKYAYGFRFGYSGIPGDSNGLVRIKNSFIKGLGPASSDYSKNNRDGIALEGGELWMMNSIISDVSDACIDAKGSVKAKNCKFEKGYRDIRIWPGQTVILSNCKVGSVWFQDNTGKLILFNTPMPTIENNSTPGIVEVVTVDPLTDPWFEPTVPAPPLDFSRLILAQQGKIEAELEFLSALKELKGN